jgi:hypothetical protein
MAAVETGSDVESTCAIVAMCAIVDGYRRVEYGVLSKYNNFFPFSLIDLLSQPPSTYHYHAVAIVSQRC